MSENLEPGVARARAYLRQQQLRLESIMQTAREALDNAEGKSGAERYVIYGGAFREIDKRLAYAPMSPIDHVIALCNKRAISDKDGLEYAKIANALRKLKAESEAAK